MRSYSLAAAIAAVALSSSVIAARADSAPPSIVEAPHLDIVLNQLRSVDDGLRNDMAFNRIPRAEGLSLQREANAVRADAIRTAHRNGGNLPAAEYDHLLGQIDNIARATEGA